MKSLCQCHKNLLICYLANILLNALIRFCSYTSIMSRHIIFNSQLKEHIIVSDFGFLLKLYAKKRVYKG